MIECGEQLQNIITPYTICCFLNDRIPSLDVIILLCWVVFFLPVVIFFFCWQNKSQDHKLLTTLVEDSLVLQLALRTIMLAKWCLG